MKRLALTIALVLLPASLSAQYTPEDMEILYELDGVAVLIEVASPERVGLDPVFAVERVEDRLVSGGLDVLRPSDYDRGEEIPVLLIRVRMVSVTSFAPGVYAYVVDLELREPVEIFRNRSGRIDGTTWRAIPRSGIAGDRRPDEIVFDLERMADDFVNAWLSANADLIRRR